MNFRTGLGLILGSSAAISASIAIAGCFQTIDNGVVAGSPNSTATSTPVGELVDAGFPSAFAGTNLMQQCATGSALCFQLCNSPECGTSDGGPNNVTLPPVLATLPVILPDGGESTSPCDQLEAESVKIRTESCAQCHSTDGQKLVWTYVLDDNQLVSTNAPGLAPPTPLVIPGNPAGSILLQKMELGLAGGQLGMPPSPSQALGLTSPDAAATIVYPTPEDLSMMYAWILACAPGADGGAYQSQYGGGNYGPDGGSTVSVTASPIPATDAGPAQ